MNNKFKAVLSFNDINEEENIKKEKETIKETPKQIKTPVFKTKICPLSFEEDIPKKDTEEKMYLLLLVSNEDSDNKTWNICYGRTETYEYLKSIISEINIKESLILTETYKIDKKTQKGYWFLISPEEALSVYAFFKHLEALINDTGFDIEDYNIDRDSSYYKMNEEEMSNTFGESYDIYNALINGELNENNNNLEETDFSDKENYI